MKTQPNAFVQTTVAQPGERFECPPPLLAEKLLKKARKAALVENSRLRRAIRKNELGKQLFELVKVAQSSGWSAEDLLRTENRKQERELRRRESARSKRKHS